MVYSAGSNRLTISNPTSPPALVPVCEIHVAVGTTESNIDGKWSRKVSVPSVYSIL